MTAWWNLKLNCMPGFEQALKRVYAWYEDEIIDHALRSLYLGG